MSCNEAIVLVGGAGTRLRTVVSDRPKPLALVGGRPFIAWILDELERRGMRRVILATGYRGHMVEEVVGRRWGALDIAYSREVDPLGTGGAIRLASTLLGRAEAHVLNGDTFLEYEPACLEALTKTSGAAVGVALAAVPDVSRYGAVTRDGDRITGFSEKGAAGGGFINAGSYFLTERALRALPLQAAYSFEENVLVPQVLAGNVVGFDQTARFIDIGVPDDFRASQMLFGAS